MRSWWSRLCLCLVFAVGCEATQREVPDGGDHDADGQVSGDESDGQIESLAPGKYRFYLTTPDGRERLYDLVVPESIDGGRPAPAVLNLHGGGGSAEGAAYNTLMDAAAESHGFYLVYAEGIPADAQTQGPMATWNAGLCCGPAMEQNIDDVQYFRSLLDDLAGRVYLDRDRVYATGISNGGLMSYRLACEGADFIAAVAPVAAPGLAMPGCDPSPPVPVLHIHGTDDPCALYLGGQECGGCLQRYLNALLGTSIEPVVFPCESIPVYVDYWRSQLGCPEQGELTYQVGAASCTTWSPCSSGSEVTLCTVEGMGHTWPSGQHIEACESPLSRPCRLWIDAVGAISYDIDNDVIWEFFARHKLP